MKIASHVIGIAMVGTLAALGGCTKDSGGAAGAPSGSAASNPQPTTPAAATTTAAATPAAEKITPSAKPPFEAVMFKETPNKNEKGWPKFDMYNLSDKTVTFVALYGYAYDASNKLVARTATPLSWNGKIAPGDKASWSVEVGRSEAANVPATATSFELCYDSVTFEGDPKGASDNKRCTDKRAKGAK